MDPSDIKDKFLDLESRITKIEKILFNNQSRKKIESKTTNKYEGLTGGIAFLIDNSFFDNPKLVTEIMEELKKEGYYYGRQAVDILLRRDFVKKKKILTREKIENLWKYVIRK